MAFLTSMEQFMKIDDEKHLSDELIQGITEYLRSHLYIVRLKKMYEWIVGGGKLAFIHVSAEICDRYAEKLNEKKIPFIIVRDESDNFAFLIREKDNYKAGEVRTEVLKKISRPCSIVSTKELIAFNLATDNKGVISVTGLSAVQLEILEEMIMNGLDPEMIGEDIMQDMTYRLSLSGKDTMTDKRNLAEILLLMQMMTEGPNKDKNIMKAENRRSLERHVADALKGTRAVSYMVEGKRYMMMTPQGFEYGTLDTKNGVINFNRQMDYNKNLPDYEEQMYSKLVSFKEATFTTNVNDLSHIVSGRSVFSFSEKEKDRSACEREFAKSVNRTVMRNIGNEPLMVQDGRYATKINEIINEMGRVTKGVINGTVPIGYRDDDILELKNLMDRYDLNVRDYGMVPEALTKLEVVPVADVIEKTEQRDADRVLRGYEEEPER